MSNFNSITDKVLQGYNRAMFASNLQEDAGRDAARNYLCQFSKRDHLEIAKALAAKESMGEPAFKRALTSRMEIV